MIRYMKQKKTYFGQKYKGMTFNGNFDGITSINMNLLKFLKVKKKMNIL